MIPERDLTVREVMWVMLGAVSAANSRTLIVAMELCELLAEKNGTTPEQEFGAFRKREAAVLDESLRNLEDVNPEIAALMDPRNLEDILKGEG